MSRIKCSLKVELLSDAVFSSETSVPGREDITVLTDPNGCPIIHGSTMKGLLRESVQNLLCWRGEVNSDRIPELFGKVDEQFESPHRVVFSTLKADVDPSKPEEWSNNRTYLKIYKRSMVRNSLRVISAINMGVIFEGCLLCDSEDLGLLQDGCRIIRWAGLYRKRGMGHIRVELVPEKEIEHMAPAERFPCISYQLQVVSPLVISWKKQSEMEFSESRQYLPGSALRGMVLSKLAKEKPEFFAANQDALLNHTYFHNAFPKVEEHSQIPTPLGFYSDRSGNDCYHVLAQPVKAGDKRASLGRFCRIEGDLLIHNSPQMVTITVAKRKAEKKADARILMKRAIAEGTILEGSIYIEDERLVPEIAGAFTEFVSLGAARFAGNGICKTLSLKSTQSLPSDFLPGDPIPEELFMLLLSPMTMTKNGEPVGICKEKLAQLLGVNTVEIMGCTTSVTESAGYNRKTGCMEPTVVMYEMGSLFQLRCAPCAPTVEKLHELEKVGIGIRRPEGYGQVRFLKGFTKKTVKAYEKHSDSENPAAVNRRIRAKWLLAHADEVAKKKLPITINKLMNMQTLCDAIILGQKSIADMERFFLRPKEVYVKDQQSGTGTIMERTSTFDSVKYYEEKYQFPEFSYRRREKRKDDPEAAFAVPKKIYSDPLTKTLECPTYPDSEKERIRLLRDWCLLNLMTQRDPYGGEKDNAGNI